MGNELTSEEVADNLDEALKKVEICLKAAREQIKNELVQRINSKKVKVCTRQGKNSKSTENDYFLYLWIDVEISTRRYWITLFFNDIDTKSGNPHTQLGRIQFWRNVTLHQAKGQYSPHCKCMGGKWQFISANAKSPKSSSKCMPTNVKVYNKKDYSPQTIVNDFLQFLEDCGEVNIRKNQI